MLKAQVPGHPSPNVVERIHQEDAAERRVRPALEWLNESGAIMRGHFRFGTGRDERHGRIYVSGRRLFHIPYAGRWLTEALLDSIPYNLRCQAELVAGPQTGGMMMARDLAEFISTSRGQGEPGAEAVFLDKDPEGGYRLHPGDHERLDGRRVILVDDVRHRGVAFVMCNQLLAECGAEVLATAELIDRGCTVIPLQIPNYFVGQMEAEDLYRPGPDTCPMCSAGDPITQFK